MRSTTPRVAVAGLGGFAAEHHAALAVLEAEGACRVVATCDPDPTHPDRFRLRDRGVERFDGLEALMQAQGGTLDLLTLPTPIPLHAAQHRLAVEAGVPAYLEKPPSLWWPEFRSMLDAEAQASRLTQVGFNFVGDPFRRELKHRILADEFGALREVRLHAVWPRNAAYYGRNDWAGRLRAGDRWVLDSVIGNALAHHVQNLLFWIGKEDPGIQVELGEVRAWLARSHPIESFDTALVEATTLDPYVLLRIGATHAEAGVEFDQETLVLERATIVFDRWNEAQVSWKDGRVETLRSAIADRSALLRHNLTDYLDYVTARRLRPITTLQDTSAFVLLCGLALVGSGTIHDIEKPPDLAAFVATGRWPDAAPAPVTLHDISRLPEVADRTLSRLNR